MAGDEANNGGAPQVAQPPPAVDQANNAAANNEVDNSITRLQVWRGNGKDATTIELWIDQVDRTRTQKGWNEQRTAAAVCDALKDTAARWMAVIKSNTNKAPILENWDQLKPALKKRFADALTATQKQAFVRGLVQANNETVQDFYDRVALALSKVHQGPRAALVGNEVNGQKTGYDKSLDVTTGTLFIAGLKQETREYVEINMTETDTSERLLDLAIKSEAAKGNGARAAALKLAVVEDNQEEDTQLKIVNEELAALRTRMNTFTAGKGKGRQDTPLPPFKDRKTWFYCYKCKQHGLHVSKECKLTKTQIADLLPAPRYPNPTTTPSDKQFPNGL